MHDHDSFPLIYSRYQGMITRIDLTMNAKRSPKPKRLSLVSSAHHAHLPQTIDPVSWEQRLVLSQGDEIAPPHGPSFPAKPVIEAKASHQDQYSLCFFGS